MPERRVWTFFYGSFINPNVLKVVDVTPTDAQVARLNGFDLRVDPLANLVRSDEHCVFGVLARLSHAELDRLYGQSWVGEYRPEAVVVERSDGTLAAALCYLSPSSKKPRPEGDYVGRIIAGAEHYGFPAWYIEKLKRFRGASG